MQAEQSSKSEQHAEQARFLAFVAQLEQAAGRRLGEPWLSRCRSAYAADPEGFAECCASAIERARTNPIGLLVRMVKDRDHLRPGAAKVIPIRPGVLDEERPAPVGTGGDVWIDEVCTLCGHSPSVDVGDNILCAHCRSVQ